MNPVTIPARPRWLSLLTLLYGAILFVWLTPEDSIWLVSVLGAGLAGLLAAHALFRYGADRTFQARVWFPGVVLFGGLIGSGAVGATALLMILKTAVHSHVYADYSLVLILGIFARLPAWTLGGLLSGLAAALLLSTHEA